jgi:hypothetical protein
MATQYDWKIERSDTGNIQSATWLTLNAARTLRYRVLAFDDVMLCPVIVSPFDVIQQSFLPVVNRSLFFDQTTGKVVPWLVCSDKIANRSTQNAGLWDVDCMFAAVESSIKESDLYPRDMETEVTNYGQLTERILGENDEVAWESETMPVFPNKVPLELPTGNRYRSPFMKKVSTRRYRITQFEKHASWEAAWNAAVDRKFRINSDSTFTLPGTNVQGTEGQFYIENCYCQEIYYPLTPGGAIAYLFRYEVSFDPKLKGFFDERYLIDTHYLTQANDRSERELFRDRDGLSFPTGYINTDGTRKDMSAPGTVPESVDYQIQPATSFYDIFMGSQGGP